MLAVPLLVSRRFGPGRRAWPWALAVAIGATLPLALWHPRDFVDDVLVFQMRQPLRTESLSVTGVLGSVGVRLPGAVAFAAAAAALAWAWRRLPPDRDGLCRGTALAALAFFLAGKQAFCNYYYFAGLTLLASAALAGEGATASPRR